MIWVIDASVAHRWYLEDEAQDCADAVLKGGGEDPSRYTVPELFAGEAYDAIRGKGMRT